MYYIDRADENRTARCELPFACVLLTRFNVLLPKRVDYLDTRSRTLLTGMMKALPVRRTAGKSSIYHRVEDACVNRGLIF